MIISEVDLKSNLLKEIYNNIYKLKFNKDEYYRITFIKKNVLLNLSLNLINNNLNFNQFELLLNYTNISINNEICNLLANIEYNKLFRFYQFEYLELIKFFKDIKSINSIDLNYNIFKDLNNLIPDQTTFIYKLLRITYKDIHNKTIISLGTFNSISDKSALIYLNMVGCDDILENCKIFTLKYL